MPTSSVENVSKVSEDFFRRKSVFIVAEIGKNFIQTKAECPISEYIANAKALIDAAADAGADAVKFQTHVAEDEQLPIRVVSPHFKNVARYAWVARNARATPLSFWRAVKRHAETRGLVFFSTPMSRGAAMKLSRAGVSLWKVGSGDITDFLLLDYVCQTGKPIIISTGMVSYAELEAAVTYLNQHRAKFAVLYCVSEYPAPNKSFNLASIERLCELYPKVPIGFSDHSVGNNNIALSAINLGATIIEKHFSFSRSLWGPDHKASLTPTEMKQFVFQVRNNASRSVDHRPYYGKKNAELAGATNIFRPYFHKALVAGKNMSKGFKITQDSLYAMRPLSLSGGISAASLNAVLGKHLRIPLQKYAPLTAELFE